MIEGDNQGYCYNVVQTIKEVQLGFSLQHLNTEKHIQCIFLKNECAHMWFVNWNVRTEGCCGVCLTKLPPVSVHRKKKWC